jgi:phage terminase large subunit
VSRALPHLKAGAMRDFDSILLEENKIPDKLKNKTDSYYRIGNSIIEFFGVDQLDKVHGPSRDILFINEAYYIKYDIYIQLSLRTSKTVFIDYNPIQRYWLDEEVMNNDKPCIIHSTYRDNEYCPEGIRIQLDKKLERYNREVENRTITNSFKNWCKVYLFGEDGILEGVIFDNWRYEQLSEIDEVFKQIQPGFGLDYGFFPDPDAMSNIAIDRKRRKIYAKECIYTTNNGTEDLINQMKQYCKRNDLIIAESASPRTNRDLEKYFNIKPVRKTRTVADWLREMQDYEWIISADSYNFARELQNYIWSDKKAGIAIDEYNHMIDGARYYYMEMMMARRGMRRVN